MPHEIEAGCTTEDGIPGGNFVNYVQQAIPWHTEMCTSQYIWEIYDRVYIIFHWQVTEAWALVLGLSNQVHWSAIAGRERAIPPPPHSCI